MSLKTLLLVTCFGVLVSGLAGCVDVPTKQDNFPDFGTSTRLINASGGAADVMAEQLTGRGLSSLASIADQEATAYENIPAGDRLFKLSSDADTTLIALNSEEVATILITSDAAKRFRVFRERPAYAAIPDTGQVRVISGATGTYDVVNMADTSVVAAGVGFATSTGYLALDDGTYTLGIMESGSTTILSTVAGVTVAKGQRHTCVLFGLGADATIKSFEDDLQIREIVK